MEKHGRGHDRLREYSIELGLRTHRPSAITSSLLQSNVLEKSKSYVGLTRLQKNGQMINTECLSQCSNVPQYGDVTWWDLPVSASADYEQKTKNVRISYSVDQIYGKAKLTDLKTNNYLSSHSQFNNLAAQQSAVDTRFKEHKGPTVKYLDKTSFSDSASAVDITLEAGTKVSSLSEEGLTESRTNKWLSSYGHQHTEQIHHLYSVDVQSKTLATPRTVEHQIANDYQGSHEKPMPLSTSCLMNTNSQNVTEDIRYKTFEEAMRIYPTDESECSEDRLHFTQHNGISQQEIVSDSKGANVNETKNVCHDEADTESAPVGGITMGDNHKLDSKVMQSKDEPPNSKPCFKAIDAWISTQHSEIFSPTIDDSDVEASITPTYGQSSQVRHAEQQTTSAKQTSEVTAKPNLKSTDTDINS